MGKNRSKYSLIALFIASYIIIQHSCTVVSARVRRHKWHINNQFWSPDCVEKASITINGQFPGPVIRAQVGDTVVVEIENLIPTEGVVVHWHGIRQIGTPWYDGTAFISQCPVGPGETFIYEFVVDKPGTFFYHGHYGFQRTSGLCGAIIVDLPEGKKEEFEYDGELTIVLNDWWHKSSDEQTIGLSSNPFRWVGEPQSLLIEGRGKYNCSKIKNSASISGDSVSCNETNPQCSPHLLRVAPGKTYRLRVVSATSLSSLNLVIEDHKMTVVEADGNYVKPVVVDNLDIFSGQTYSVLITANQDRSRNYWVGINVRGRFPETQTGLAILNYLPNPSTKVPVTSAPVSPIWNDTAYSVAQSRLFVAREGYKVPLPLHAEKQIILLSTQNLVHGKIRWAVNNFSLELPPTPYLAAMKFNITNAYDTRQPPDTYPAPYNPQIPPPNPNAKVGSGIYILPYNITIDVILQNANSLTPNESEIHPWHLHGHEFRVLGYGTTAFDPHKDPLTYNLNNPPLRNTVPVYPYGWTAIRFQANNPGVWPFHCHVEPHFFMGMGVIFAEGMERLGELPKTILGCGLTKNMLP
eukprot:c15111_g1_i1 orf=240-1979(-)